MKNSKTNYPQRTTTMFLAILLSFSLTATAQITAPEIQWQNTIGGSGFDYLYSIQQTSDGGYILGGSSSSYISGDKSEASLGGSDYWVVKLDATGAIQWQNVIGGSGSDDLVSIQQTSDGGYILGGYSYSDISGDKTEASLGSLDYWVVKLDATGAIQWQNTIGGSNYDQLSSIQQTSDGGYILSGYSSSGISGDKTEAYQGGFDYWVVKLDATGAIQWQNTIGGSDYDVLYSIQQTSDGGYILGGYSDSGISGDKTEASKGGEDYWVVKLDAAGAIQWQNTIGGFYNDYFLGSIQQTSDGGYILGGDSESGNSGDKTEASKGGADYWVVKLDAAGAIQWQNTIGGSSHDRLYSIQQTSDGGYILGGWSQSGISGDKTEALLGGNDYWVVKLNGNGVIKWQNTIGGSSIDDLYSIQQTSDGGYILGGRSESGISGDKTEVLQGGIAYDYWVVKLYSECYQVFYADADGDGYGNAAVSNCSKLPGYVTNSTDCNDANAAIYPSACDAGNANGIDDNCDGLIDDGFGAINYYVDGDGDGYGTGIELSLCENPGSDYSLNNSDCDDANASVYPGACDAGNDNGIDDNCDGFIDDGFGAINYYVDADGDGYGTGIELSLCENPGSGYSLNNSDCDDANASIYPGACDAGNGNGIDDNCDGIADDGFSATNYYVDADGDGYGASSELSLCENPGSGYSLNNTDCDDTNSEVNPIASEIFNGLDDNCDGIIDIACNPPTELIVKNLTATSVKFKWGYSATSYKLRYKVATLGTWTLLGPNGQTKTVEGLLANTNYVWQVKSVCNVDPKIISEWSAKQFFTSAPFKVSTETEIPSLEVYPNPFSNSATISFSLPEATHAYIELFDLAGRKLQTIVDKDLSSGNHEVIFQRGQLSSGLYLLQVKLGDILEVRKLVVE
ncbi:MAG: T9SS type A sorting domain-containing protein [Chitinophagaceae bacterium]|nr:T9SS type A sorting domain-containing protein [Chitinophagaceae bacterium]